MVTRLATSLAFACVVGCGLSAEAIAQLAPEDDINPAEARIDWLPEAERAELFPEGANATTPPYVLDANERKKFPHTFGVNFSHYDFDINANRSECRSQDGYENTACSCTVNWDTLISHQIVFTYSKASDGGDVDLSFRRYWKQLEKHHKSGTLYRGGYHFLRATPDAKTQADAFLKAINGTTKEQLPPILDIEWMNRRITQGTPEFDACPAARRTKRPDGTYLCDMWYKSEPEEIVALASKWIDIVQKATDKPVIIYTNVTGWWNSRLGKKAKVLLKDGKHDRAFWLSRYTRNGPAYSTDWTKDGGSSKWGMPMLPAGMAWNEPEYKTAHFWQFTEDGWLQEGFYNCKGKILKKPMELNYVPVSKTAFEKLFVAP